MMSRMTTLRRAALVTIAGDVLASGTPFASFYALPKLLDATSAAQTSQNILASPGLLVAALLVMLLNFVGDILSAWGLYVLLRPVNALMSTLVAWFRIVYTGAGLVAVLNLAVAHRLLTDPHALAALGRTQLDAHVQIALLSFQAEFDFSLILFGIYLTMLGWLFTRAPYIPKWLGVLLILDGLGWIGTEVGPFLLPHTNVDFLMITSVGELVLLVWLIGWGLRLKEPVSNGEPLMRGAMETERAT
jgi:hypothetical protein